jgi:Tfp pilus assembly protein PilF
MNRRHLAVVASILTVGALAAATPAAFAQDQTATIISYGSTRTLADVIEQAERGVVVVAVKGLGSNPNSQGSGFFIDPIHVVTNRHVIEDGGFAEVQLKNGRSYRVEGIVAEDSGNDLVLLRIDIPRDAGQRALPLNTTEPRKGEEVYALGAPRGLEFSVSRGIVSAIREMSGMTTSWVIQTDAAISPGNSGGPLINANGEVVGVTSFMRTDGQNLGFAQRAWHVAALCAGGTQTLRQWQDGRFGEIYQKALAAYRAQRFDAAIPLLKRVVEIRPDHADAWFELGYALDEVGKPREAIVAFERHLRNGATGSSAANAFFNIGIILQKLGDPSRASRAFRAVLERDPDNTGALGKLAGLAWKASNWEDAARYYSRLLQLEPGNGPVRKDLSTAISNIGVEDLRAGRTWAAANRFQEALQVDIDNNYARLNLGLAAHDLGYGGTVQQVWFELVARDPALAERLRPFVR